jgi:diguanylate cyclase (GGDEF)-like protein
VRVPARPRLSLVQSFGIVSLAVVVALGAVLATVLHARVQHRALAQSVSLVRTLARADVGPLLPAGRRQGPLPAGSAAQLDRWAKAAGLAAVKLYSADGTIAYATDRSLVGRSEAADADIRAALAGRTRSDIEQQTDEVGSPDHMLEVYVPIASGVFEGYLPYAPVEREITRDTRTIILVLALGLLALWLALYRLADRASRELRHQATHDPLTGLPNRVALHEQGARCLAASRREHTLAALLLIDLDRFKEVNDTLGHDHGDELLVEVAERLRGVLRRGDVLARLGGDEFAVLTPNLPHRGALGEVATRLHAALVRPFEVRSVTVELGGSIGIAIHGTHGEDMSTLLRRADVAMYEAKREHTHIETYDPERDPYSADRLTLLAELRTAIDGGELELHFQPKVRLEGREVIGVEALLRWNHPERGLLPPVAFLPLAESTGMMADVTRWVLDAALAQCAAWREAGIDLPVAVNLAAANVADRSLPDVVASLLARHAVPGDRLECEISEDTVMADPRRTTENLQRLRTLGVRMALDDFGTGHSSLSYLKRLPLDEVKIDRSFVMGMANDASDAAIVRSTIDIARHLGLSVVAEGVETEETLGALSDLRCDVAQGYLLSRPMPADRVGDWLAARV